MIMLFVSSVQDERFSDQFVNATAYESFFFQSRITIRSMMTNSHNPVVLYNNQCLLTSISLFYTNMLNIVIWNVLYCKSKHFAIHLSFIRHCYHDPVSSLVDSTLAVESQSHVNIIHLIIYVCKYSLNIFDQWTIL